MPGDPEPTAAHIAEALKTPDPDAKWRKSRRPERLATSRN
jgi:hypothetical protein